VEEHQLVELLEQVDQVQEVAMAHQLAEQQVMKDLFHHQKEMLVVMVHMFNVLLTLEAEVVDQVELELMAQ
tara:strand:- start:229 stop:441 length:213 start_codon:yes stop_codon:yes gene_type:complete